MADIIKHPRATGTGGGGPDGPMLEQRIGRLEERMERIERILMELRPKITEILLTGAKQSDLQAMRVEIAEIKGKVSMLPTWWMFLLGIVATWGAGAALVRFL